MHRYYTGDVCAITDEGQMLFVGRQDDQVKIVGNRTEMGEIETAIYRIADSSIRAVKVFYSLAKRRLMKSIAYF